MKNTKKKGIAVSCLLATSSFLYTSPFLGSKPELQETRKLIQHETSEETAWFNTQFKNPSDRLQLLAEEQSTPVILARAMVVTAASAKVANEVTKAAVKEVERQVKGEKQEKQVKEIAEKGGMGDRSASASLSLADTQFDALKL